MNQQLTFLSLALAGALTIARAAAPEFSLKLVVVSTLPEPVIGKGTPGAEEFPGGFEGGTTIKVETAGKKRYHQFATGMGNMDWSENHLEYWVSDDGKDFQRKDVLRHQYVNKETGKTHQSLHPYPFFSGAENRWYMIFMEYVVDKQWDGESGKIWCVPSRNNGPEGIEGPWNFDERYEFVPKQCAPFNNSIPVATSTSSPFQVKDGRWAVLVSTNYYENGLQRWPVMLHFSEQQKGPFLPAKEAVSPPMIEPTGYVENALVMKVKGPASGRDYWVAVFDFLAPEVAHYQPGSVFGFSYSEDGIHWPKEHGQAVNINDGLTPGQQGWWRNQWAVRTPHQLVDEGNGTYSVFFTGATTDDYFKGFRAMGKTTVRLVEE